MFARKEDMTKENNEYGILIQDVHKSFRMNDDVTAQGMPDTLNRTFRKFVHGDGNLLDA